MQVKNGTIIYEGHEFYTVEVDLPKTSLLIIGNNLGFVMCGALDVAVYNTPKLLERNVICANAIGVRTINDLFEGKINASSLGAQNIGIVKELPVKEALLFLVQ